MGDLTQLISMLGGSHSEQTAAIEQLVALGELAVPPLCDLMALESGRTSWAAAIALGRLRDPQAFPDLLRALRATDPVLGSMALEALLAYRRPDLPVMLVEALPETHIMVQQSVILALQRLGDKRIIPGLLAALATAESPTMRSAIIQTFGRLKAIVAVPAIRAYAADPDCHVREWVELVLAQLAPEAPHWPELKRRPAPINAQNRVAPVYAGALPL